MTLRRLSQAFCVNWQDNYLVRPFALSSRLTIDGQRCGGVVLKSTEVQNRRIKLDPIRTSATIIRPLVFGTLELTGTCFVFENAKEGYRFFLSF
jgi:hypothetical protein